MRRAWDPASGLRPLNRGHASSGRSSFSFGEGLWEPPCFWGGISRRRSGRGAPSTRSALRSRPCPPRPRTELSWAVSMICPFGSTPGRSVGPGLDETDRRKVSVGPRTDEGHGEIPGRFLVLARQGAGWPDAGLHSRPGPVPGCPSGPGQAAPPGTPAPCRLYRRDRPGPPLSSLCGGPASFPEPSGRTHAAPWFVEPGPGLRIGKERRTRGPARTGRGPVTAGNPVTPAPKNADKS